MDRKDFYKLYYTRTDKKYSDHIILSDSDRKEAWQKGQTYTSKFGRKAFILLQYLYLLAAIICFLRKDNRLGIVLCALFFFHIVLTDFSITKIETLYFLYRRKSIFSSILLLSFKGDLDQLWSSLRPMVKSKISGFMPSYKWKFRVKYHVLYKKNSPKANILFCPNQIIIKISDSTYTLRNRQLSWDELTAKIADILMMDHH